MKVKVISPHNRLKIVWHLVCFGFYTVAFSALITSFALGYLEISTVNIIVSFCTISCIAAMSLIDPIIHSNEYHLDEKYMRIKQGYFRKREFLIPLKRIVSVDIAQGPMESLFSIGQIHLSTSPCHMGGLNLKLIGIRNTHGTRQLILNHIRNSENLIAS